MPNLASSYQLGSGRVSREFQVGSYLPSAHPTKQADKRKMLIWIYFYNYVYSFSLLIFSLFCYSTLPHCLIISFSLFFPYYCNSSSLFTLYLFFVIFAYFTNSSSSLYYTLLYLFFLSLSTPPSLSFPLTTAIFPLYSPYAFFSSLISLLHFHSSSLFSTNTFSSSSPFISSFSFYYNFSS